MAVATISLWEVITDTADAPVANVDVTLTFDYNGATTADGLLLPSVRRGTTDSTGRVTFAKVIPNDLISPANTVYIVQTPFRNYQVALQSGNGASQQSTAANVIVNAPGAILAQSPSLAGIYAGSADFAIRSLSLLTGAPFVPAAGLPAGAIIGTARYAPSPPPFYFYGAIAGATATDVADYKFYRNAAYTGGTHGFVNNALRLQVDVGVGVTAYEWGLMAILNNGASDGTSENVALVAQANKQAAGATWVMVLQPTDTTGLADPLHQLIGLEIDMQATGSDVHGTRVGIDVNIGSVAGVHAGIGVLVDGAVGAVWDTGISLRNIGTTGIELKPPAAQVGIDFESGTFAKAAIRFARQQTISLEPTDTIQILTLGAVDTVLKLANGGVEKIGFDINAPAIRMNAVQQVLTVRQLGYTNAWTGAVDRATAFNTGTVTLAQLAQRVAAIQTDLTTHGLIGP
jgi:hypothetical protein